MKQGILRIVTMVVISLIVTHAAQAQTLTYIVLPFRVNAPPGYTYLEKAIPSMLTSRLYKDKCFQPLTDAEAAKIAKTVKIEDLSEGRKVAADVIIGGEVSIVGDDAVLDIRVYKNGEVIWRSHKNTKVNDLIAALQELTDGINQSVSIRELEASQAKEEKVVPAAKSKEDRPQKEQAYCNPQFHYQEDSATRNRSQALPFASIGIIVADVTGDKKREIVLLGERQVSVYRWENDRLILLGTHKLSRSIEPLAIRAFDFKGDGVSDIIISAVEPTYGKPSSLVLSYRNKEFKEVAANISLYMNVVKLPPDFTPTVVGQSGGSSHIFSRRGVYRVEFKGKSFELGSQLLLPQGANVFNFAWIPNADGKGENKLILVNNREQLVAYGATGSKLAVTGEVYYGSAAGINEPMNMPGLGKPRDLIPTKYFIPIRMTPIFLENKKRWVLLASRSISVAAQFFENYRAFAEGEIRTLVWDGTALDVAYKTPLIRASITDFTVADINNDGRLELVVSTNNYTGVPGLGKRRTTVMFFPMGELNKK